MWYFQIANQDFLPIANAVVKVGPMVQVLKLTNETPCILFTHLGSEVCIPCHVPHNARYDRGQKVQKKHLLFPQFHCILLRIPGDNPE